MFLLFLRFIALLSTAAQEFKEDFKVRKAYRMQFPKHNFFSIPIRNWLASHEKKLLTFLENEGGIEVMLRYPVGFQKPLVDTNLIIFQVTHSKVIESLLQRPKEVKIYFLLGRNCLSPKDWFLLERECEKCSIEQKNPERMYVPEMKIYIRFSTSAELPFEYRKAIKKEQEERERQRSIKKNQNKKREEEELFQEEVAAQEEIEEIEAEESEEEEAADNLTLKGRRFLPKMRILQDQFSNASLKYVGDYFVVVMDAKEAVIEEDQKVTISFEFPGLYTLLPVKFQLRKTAKGNLVILPKTKKLYLLHDFHSDSYREYLCHYEYYNLSFLPKDHYNDPLLATLPWWKPLSNFEWQRGRKNSSHYGPDDLTDLDTPTTFPPVSLSIEEKISKEND